MGTTTLVIARTDSEAATLLTTNIDSRDHSFILGSTNPLSPPLVEVMLEAEKDGKSGNQLQAIEDTWMDNGQLKPYPDVLLEAMKKSGSSSSKVNDFRSRLSKHNLSTRAMLKLAKQSGLKEAPYWDCDTPRTREGYYRYQGGTQCAINRAVAFAPYADLLWMETKSPIYEQAKEFAEGVHRERPGQWLAYNLSPSFNWEQAGLNKQDTKDYVWKLGKLGFIFQFITVSCPSSAPLPIRLFSVLIHEQLAGLHSNAYINELFASSFKTEGMKAYVELIQRREREIGCDVLTHQKVSEHCVRAK